MTMIITIIIIIIMISIITIIFIIYATFIYLFMLCSSFCSKILTATFCLGLFRRPGGLCQAVQAAPDQAGLHPGRRRPGPRHPLRQRFLPDDDLPVRGAAAEFQEHVQAEAPAPKVARRGECMFSFHIMIIICSASL